MSPQEGIDVHAHFLPPFYSQALRETGYEKPDGMPFIPEWSEEAHLAMMEKLSISKSILSISSPGTYLEFDKPAQAIALTRRCNDYASELTTRHPSKFGFWASLPLPDIDASLVEIAYVFDTLHADGVVLSTNHQGFYPGDEHLDVIFKQLNRRKARIFIHPTTPCLKARNDHGPTPITPLASFPNPMLEFMFESTRAVMSLFQTNTIRRNPDLTFVIPHAGAVMPALLDRVTTFAGPLLDNASLTAEAVREALNRQFYFDLAGVPFPAQIQGLLLFVGRDKLLYGSDFPFTSVDVAERFVGIMDACLAAWGSRDVEMVLVGNAERLLSE